MRMLFNHQSLVVALQTFTISGTVEKEIKIALSDTNLSQYIRSVEILPIEELQEKCGILDSNLLGCAVSMFNDTTDEFEYARIYLSDFTNYTGCKTFRRVLYHEIGHVEYSYRYGTTGNGSVREQYADEYADRFEKDGCIKL